MPRIRQNLVERRLVLLLCCVVMFVGWALPVEAQGSVTTEVVGSGVGLNLRDDPSFDAPVIATISDGDRLTLVGKSGPVMDSDGATRWWHVRYGDLDGWVVGAYLAIDGGSSARFPDGTAEIDTDDGTGANLREGPGTQSAIIATLTEATSVDVLDGPSYDDNNWPWFRVSAGSVSGYARTDVLGGQAAGSAPTAFAYSAAEIGRVPVLMYHHVDYSGNHYSVTPEQLATQCAWLVDNGYTAITLWQFYDAAFNGGSLPAKPVVLTADDGWASAITFAAVLADYGLIGNYFVNSNAEVSADQIAYLAQVGEIAAHTAHHQTLSLLGYDGQYAEVYDNRVYLESITGGYVPFLAWPYGDSNASAVQAAANAGIIAAFDAGGGAAVIGAIDPYHIPRIEITVWDDLDSFASKVEYA